MESNDSPEIPDRGETSDIPGLPSGAVSRVYNLCPQSSKELTTAHSSLFAPYSGVNIA